MGSHLLATEPATMKAFISLALLAASYASDPYGPPAPYAPAPAYAPVPAVHAPAYHAPAPVDHAPAYHAPAPAYHAAPHPAPYHEETPKNYQFGYDVHGYDEYGNPNVHSRTEQRDGYNVKGQYRVELPDCRVQIVDYFVDEYKQYHADVKYEGTPCPDKSLSSTRKVTMPQLQLTMLLQLLQPLPMPQLKLMLQPLHMLQPLLMLQLQPTSLS